MIFIKRSSIFTIIMLCILTCMPSQTRSASPVSFGLAAGGVIAYYYSFKAFAHDNPTWGSSFKSLIKAGFLGGTGTMCFIGSIIL